MRRELTIGVPICAFPIDVWRLKTYGQRAGGLDGPDRARFVCPCTDPFPDGRGGSADSGGSGQPSAVARRASMRSRLSSTARHPVDLRAAAGASSRPRFCRGIAR